MTDLFKTKMNEWIAITDSGLEKYVPQLENYQKNIYEAMRYSLMAGGKRIRPVLAFACADVLNVDYLLVEPFACSLEMIHTYSLIHDDLPAMDNDEFRRGKPTCHKQFNEALAILAGDGLLNKAFEVMGQAVAKMENKDIGIAMFNCVASASGSEGMIGGQVVDLESEGEKVSSEVLEYTYRCKTGALLKAPVLVSIEAAGIAASEAAMHLEKYAEIIGLAFQIKDDILDITGDSILMGKDSGRDEKEGKTTLISIFGLNYCQMLLSELTEEAIVNAKWFGDKGWFLIELAEFLLKRDF